jgi:hypothetical protein
MRYFVFALLFCIGCSAQQPPPPPKFVVTGLENEVFQFQYDTGDAFEAGVFINFLDSWLKEHPELVVKSFIPQMTTTRDGNGRNITRTHGMLVFTRVDPTKIKQEPAKEGK